MKQRGRAECKVLNYGDCAYVGIQMAALAWELLDRIDPDLIIFAISNLGAPAFLKSKPVEPYFLKKPEFWDLLLPEDSITRNHPALRKIQIRTFFHSGLIRQFFLFLSTRQKENEKPLWIRQFDKHENRNIQSVRHFFKRTKKRVQSVLFNGPFCDTLQERKEMLEYGRGLGIPVYMLSAKGKSEEYKLIHPPAHVMKWYAANIVDWLEKENLVPTGLEKNGGRPNEALP